MGGDFDGRSLRSPIRASLSGAQATNSRPEFSPILLDATNTCRNFFDYAVSHIPRLNRLCADRYTSVTSCFLCFTVMTHRKPYAASLTGIVPAENMEMRSCDGPFIDALSEKEPSFASCDPSSYKIEATSATIPRARTSWRLPPLPFQIAADVSARKHVPAPMHSIETPSRPLLRRSESSFTSTSNASSSFYRRSITESSLSCEPSTISPKHFVDDLSTYSSPLSRYQPTCSPEVPPIPEKWANRTSHQTPHPASLRRGLPHATYWKYESSPGLSGSWVTESPTGSEKRDPSICRYPIFTPPPRTPIRSDSSTSRILDDRVEHQSSYEGLRKDGSYRPFSNDHIHENWSDLDDREDSKNTKRRSKKRESRTLVKKRQP